MASSSRTNTTGFAGHFSRSSSPVDEDEVPDEFTASVVLFKGPDVLLFPELVRLITSQLEASPSTPLKVLEDVTIPRHTKYLSDHAEPSLLKFTIHAAQVSPYREWTKWRINTYDLRTKPVSGRGSGSWRSDWRWDSGDLETIEIPEMLCTHPPPSPAELFSGVVAFFSAELTCKAGGVSSAYPAGSRSVVQSLMDVFEAFGGTVCSELSKQTTHCISVDAQRGENHDMLSIKTISLAHPHWLCISVGLGAIAPISLFELKDEHPVTSTTEDDRYSYYRTVIKNGFLPYVDRPNLANKAGLAPGVFTVAGLAIAGLDAPPTSSIAALVGRRLYFDISATPEGRRGAPPQLSEAVAAFVGRSGARVVRDVRAADWLVVTERSGDAYWHGLQHPTKIMGTLQHLLAHFDRADEEPIDPRSSLLYFPLPVTTPTTPARLPQASIYISHHYPKPYRRYLADLAETLDQRQRPLASRREGPYDPDIIISPSKELAEEDKLTSGDPRLGTCLLPKFLEDSFVLLPDPPLFDAGTASFIRKDLECFSPRKLPKNFHLAEHRPARLDDEDYNKLNDVEKNWDHYSSVHRASNSHCRCNVCVHLS